jgi:phage baseplate assembly protein gpV
MDYSTDREEVTAFGDANKTYVQGLPDVTVEFSGFYDDTDSTVRTAAASADGSKAYLYVSTDAATKYAYGPCWVDFSIEVGVDGAVTISGSLAANGSWGLNL